MAGASRPFHSWLTVKLEYHWDADLYEALMRYRAKQLINLANSIRDRKQMASPADIAKLIHNMKRAQTLIDRGASEAEKNTAIMDRFEARLNHMGDHFSKIDEYEKQLAAMDQLGNGGPPLTDTFQPASESPQSGDAPKPVAPPFDHATGDPVK